MTRYFHLLETRNRFANGDLWHGRARGAAACVRGHGGGRNVGLWMMMAARGVDYTPMQTAGDMGFMYGGVPETEKVYKDTSNT